MKNEMKEIKKRATDHQTRIIRDVIEAQKRGGQRIAELRDSHD